MNFWTRAQLFNPQLVRLLARQRYGRALSTEEIAKASGLPLFDVYAIAQANSWEHIKHSQMHAYLVGCNCDFEHRKTMERVDKYLMSQPNLTYLKRNPEWKTYYLPLLIAWRTGYGETVDPKLWAPLRDLVVRLTPLLGRRVG
jgi:hypothetical protein